MKEYSRRLCANKSNELYKLITAVYTGLLFSIMCPTTTAQAQGQNQILKIAPTYKIGSKELIVTDSTTKEEITYQLAVIAKKH